MQAVQAFYHGDEHEAATIIEREAVEPAVRPLVEAARDVLAECQVAAPGPHFRWDDEYYEAFNKLVRALEPWRHMLEE